MSNRGSKREVATIDDEDSFSKQPAVKIVKKETEPIPSAEVIDLQKKVAELERKLTKSEKNFKGACRIAGEADARVQFLENLIDSKPTVDDDAKNKELHLEKKVNELAKQLEEMRVDRITRLVELTNQLVVSRKETENANEEIRELKRENDSLKLEMADMTCEMNRIAQQPRMQQSQLPMQQPHWGTVMGCNAGPPYFVPNQAHPHNILQLCDAGSLEAISLDNVHKKIASVVSDYGRSKVFEYIWKRMGDEGYGDLRCEVCQKMLGHPQDVLGHFLSQGHIKKVRSRRTAVSLAAFKHWFGPLEPYVGTMGRH